MKIDLKEANEQLRPLTAKQRIEWALEHFGEQTAMLSSMQKNDSVLMHLFADLDAKNEILFVDTQFHFKETLQLRDEFMRRYKLNIMTLYPEQDPEQQELVFGKKLFSDQEGQPQCCTFRKEKPLLDHLHLQKHKLIISGMRRNEGNIRENLDILVEDPRFSGYNLHPIVDWDDKVLSDYLKCNEVPTHKLHSQNYPSIGCAPCTTPIQQGEDIRAGRWRHLRTPEESGPAYCGINFTDGGGI